jgi:hypothetical protein
MRDRNLKILEHRRSGQSFAAIGELFGISSVRVRQVVEREEARLQRAAELSQAAALRQQPNVLHLPPRLRSMLAKACGKTDFTPQDVIALDYTPAMFSTKLTGFSARDWKDLCWRPADCP